MARRPTITLEVIRTEWLTGHLVRLVLGGPGFDGFTPNGCTDAYVKLLFGDEDSPTMRTYTVRSVDAERRELAVDFVVHGEEGVAGPWAAAAQPGDPVRLVGPGGAYRPSPVADWHLLAGDESAVPAIAAAVEQLPADAVGYVFLEVADGRDHIDLHAPEGVEVRWLHRGGPAADAPEDSAGRNAPIVTAVRNAEWLDGRPHVFAHGEAETTMKGIRPYIRKERGVPAEWASISGYWRRGRTEEGFRVWKRDLAEADKQPTR